MLPFSTTAQKVKTPDDIQLIFPGSQRNIFPLHEESTVDEIKIDEMMLEDNMHFKLQTSNNFSNFKSLLKLFKLNFISVEIME
jgi:hypothetical protein